MKKLIITISSIAFVVAVLFAHTTSVKANPSLFDRKQSAPATTTLAYMGPGTGTTTLAYDLTKSGQFGANSAVLLIQFNASSTNSTLAWKYEYAQGTGNADCVVNQDACDWYQSDAVLSSFATSTVHVRTFAENTWLFASSTIGSSINPIGTSTKMVEVPVPTRYVRVVYYMPVGSLRGAVWSEWVAKKEIPQ